MIVDFVEVVISHYGSSSLLFLFTLIFRCFIVFFNPPCATAGASYGGTRSRSAFSLRSLSYFGEEGSAKQGEKIRFNLPAGEAGSPGLCPGKMGPGFYPGV